MNEEDAGCLSSPSLLITKSIWHTYRHAPSIPRYLSLSAAPSLLPRPERRKIGQELSIEEHHRFEGISDPDDMSVLYAVEASDGTRGTIVDVFGVYANPELGAALQNIVMRENR